MSDELKSYNFRAKESLKKVILEGMELNPQISNMSDFIRQAIYAYASTGDHFDKEFDDEELNSILRLVGNLLSNHEEKMIDRIAAIHIELSQIIYLLKSKSSPEEIEITNYIAMITRSLFEDNLEKVLSTRNPQNLFQYLQYDFHGDYLSDWFDVQIEAKTLRIINEKLVWDEEKLRRIYND